MSWSARSARSARACSRLLLALFGALVALVLLAGPASAHAELVWSDPADGATLPRTPDLVRLHFDEEIAARFSSVRVVDGAGDDVGGSAVPRDDGGRDLALRLPQLADGSYGVLWRVVAEDDGHATSGALAFSVGAPGLVPAPVVRSALSQPVESGPKPLDVALRWLRLGLLSVVFGGLAVVGLVLSRPSGVDGAAPLLVANSLARQRILALVTGCAAAGAAAGLADPVVESERVAASGAQVSVAGLVTLTHWGHLWLVHEVGLILLVGLARRARASSVDPVARPTGAWALPTAMAGAVVGLAAVEALGSHAAALGWPAVTILTLHALAACTWLGALVAVAVLVWPQRRPEGVGPLELLRGVGARLSWLLGAGVTVLVATGLVTAGWQVSEVARLTSTTYGQALLVKVGLVAVALALGGANLARLHQLWPFRRAGRPPRAMSWRSVLVEVFTVALVMVASGVLAESAPARGPAPRPPVAAARPASAGASVGDLVVSITVSPNQAGLNAFTVQATSTRRPQPAVIDTVALHWDRAGATNEVALRAVSPGLYFGTGTLGGVAAPGTTPVTMSVVVRRDGRSVVVRLPWSVSPPPAAAAPVRPGRRTAPYADGLALGVIAFAATLAVAIARRRTDDDAVRPREPTLEVMR